MASILASELGGSKQLTRQMAGVPWTSRSNKGASIVKAFAWLEKRKEKSEFLRLICVLNILHPLFFHLALCDRLQLILS